MVHVERVVGRGEIAGGRFAERSGGVALIEDIPVFQPEIQHERLGLPGRHGGGIEQVDVAEIPVADADAAHGETVGRPLTDEVAEPEERVRGIAVAGQDLVLRRGRMKRCGGQEQQPDQQKCSDSMTHVFSDVKCKSTKKSKIIPKRKTEPWPRPVRK